MTLDQAAGPTVAAPTCAACSDRPAVVPVRISDDVTIAICAVCWGAIPER